jgi:two-component system sensor histidine kinase HydH
MASVLRGENGEHLGALAIFRDLTEIRQLRDEIARSQRLASLGSLAAGVAHEIRNPLSSIKGFATYFRDRYKDNPEDSGTAQIMIEEVDRLNRVISQLLELSRPSGLRLENMDLASIIRHVLVLTGEEAREKGLSLRADLPEKPVTALVDHDKIEQALLNIVLNALQASESGGSVTVALKREPGGRALVSVADTGKGISREDLPRIFDPYFTTKPSGTGLGLAIVHKILEAHGGEIRAASEKGQGTTMEIYIPVEGEK